MTFDWLLQALAVVAAALCVAVIWIVARQELSA